MGVFNFEDELDAIARTQVSPQPAIDFAEGIAFMTPQEINGSYLPGPDGYEMVLEDIVVDAYSTSFFNSITPSCDPDTLVCSLTPNAVFDANGTTNI